MREILSTVVGSNREAKECGLDASCPPQLARLPSLVHTVDDAVFGALVSENWKLQRLCYLLLI